MDGRTIERHRSDIRSVFDSREIASADEARLAEWLAERVFPPEVRESALLNAFLSRCRQERIEPPRRVGRIFGAGRASMSGRDAVPRVPGRDRLLFSAGTGPPPVPVPIAGSRLQGRGPCGCRPDSDHHRAAH
ncbi:DUF4158 domain-containing protein [Arthrobacter sp. 2MCAF14]|uniref:DUF4158 domain-containing protein n=1 Tax=Arthrobacter sp. 2MCAF14 TaxID=3232982 RepID=UPI003F8E3FE7